MPKIKRNGGNKKNYNPEEFANKLEKRTKKFAIKPKFTTLFCTTIYQSVYKI